jgi:hypothetical protein
MTTTEQAIRRRDLLHRHSKQLLEAFALVPTLAKFGEVQSIGSFSYGLMQVTDLKDAG